MTIRVVYIPAVTGEPSQQSFGRSPDRKAGDDIAGPMGEQHDPACDQPGTDQPYHVALPCRQSGCGGSQRANVDGMAGGKRIVFFSGYWHPAPVGAQRSAIRTLLVEDALEEVR